MVVKMIEEWKRSIVEPTLLCGFEVKMLNVEDCQRLEAVALNCLSRICGLRRLENAAIKEIWRCSSRVPKIVDLLLFTALHRQLAPPALDHIGLFLRGKTVFIFLPLLLANCLAPSALSNLKSCTNIHGAIGTGN